MADHHQQQYNIDEIKRFTVGIMRSADSDLALGTGVIVTDDGLIVTCYHVISDLYKKIISSTFYVSFPAQPGIRLPAQVVAELCNSSVDIAFLQLQGDLPKQVAVANLSETIDSKHTFQSFGFRKQKAFDGLYADGIIQGKVHKKFKEDDRISLQEVIQLKSDGIDHGMSGAAVFDTQINSVIGIASEYLATSSNVDRNLALAIPIESIIKVYPELKQKNQGLKKFNNFLQAVGRGGSLIYDKFEDVYVPPVEYDEIINVLDQRRCVFISGPAEYGKTFTAIKLLWEYYKRNYKPIFIEEGSQEELEIIQRLLRFDTKLEHHIIYFEDPFGKIKYKPNQRFEEIIGNIKPFFKAFKDTFIIISSREEVFNEFVLNKTKVDDTDLRDFKISLNKVSYKHRSLRILLNWAIAWECKWLVNEDLKNMIIELVKEQKVLSSPLKIFNFVIEYRDTTSRQVLIDKIGAKPSDVAEIFAKEIKEMTDDNILLLVFPFISDHFSVDFVQKKYQKLVLDLGIKSASNFTMLLDSFVNSAKIEINYHTNYQTLRFVHQSYSEAINYIISENSQIKKILTKVLIKLANDKETSEYVVGTVVANFDKLSDKVRNELLVKLTGSKIAAENVAWSFGHISDKLSDKVRNECLLKLVNSELHNILQGYNRALLSLNAEYIINNYANLSEDVRNLLLKAADKNKETAGAVAKAVVSDYDKLPEDVRNQLLLKLAEEAVSFVHCNFMPGMYTDAVPENPRNQVLLTLADCNEVSWDIAGLVLERFDKLPEDVRNQLLLKLADKRKAAYRVTVAIIRFYNRLPDNIRNLLFKMADNKDTAGDVADAVARNFDQLPENVRNKLQKILAKHGHKIR